jgi:hypothetical protein
MDCPLFLVLYINGSWLMEAMAILHGILAHLPLGSGLLTVGTEQVAVRRTQALWLALARTHAVLVVLLSTVLGALTGAGSSGLEGPVTT